jgi:hypothetical protein
LQGAQSAISRLTAGSAPSAAITSPFPVSRPSSPGW